jgi:hypothetical protein
MEGDSKPNFENYEAALNEYFKNQKVESIRCERCNGLIKITALSNTAWAVNCECGLYKDTLRGL